MHPASVPLSLLLAASSCPVYAATFTGGDGHPHGHLGKAWEVAVGLSLALLLFGATLTIIVVTIRQRRRKRQQAEQPDFSYASHLPPKFLPSMPYGISRPSSVYQPRAKYGRKSSPDRSSRLKESV